MSSDARSAADAVARRSYGKLVAFLAARTRDVAAAEDALSDAFAAALAEWAVSGPPANPEAWLLTVARRKAIDAARGRQRAELAAERVRDVAEELRAAADVEISDERLALMFACAHPAIDPGVHAPLMLQVVLGLDAGTIASAFLTSPSAMGKRLVRAKEKMRRAGVPFRIPEREELASRLGGVLAAIYAAYTEGWTDHRFAHSGTCRTRAARTSVRSLGERALRPWIDFGVARRELTDEAAFLASLVVELLPEDPEALGLLALILYAEARRGSRRANGEYVPLAEQDPASWDERMMAGAEALLFRASARGVVGRYQLEAALQSAHVHRCRTGRANWAEVVQLYDALLALVGSPVVAINRALAVAELHGAKAGLDAMDAIANDARLAEYQPHWAARAELLAKTGAHEEARSAYGLAIGLERDPAVRRFLERRRSRM